MLGKIAAAVVGDRIAGRNKGAKGAVLGIVAATALKRAIPTMPGWPEFREERTTNGARAGGH